jgi:hypothetical protein
VAYNFQTKKKKIIIKVLMEYGSVTQQVLSPNAVLAAYDASARWCTPN